MRLRHNEVPTCGSLNNVAGNPIETTFSKFKAFLKKTAARTKDDLWDAIAQPVDTFSPQECENYFAAAGYDCE